MCVVTVTVVIVRRLHGVCVRLRVSPRLPEPLMVAQVALIDGQGKKNHVVGLINVACTRRGENTCLK